MRRDGTRGRRRVRLVGGCTLVAMALGVSGVALAPAAAEEAALEPDAASEDLETPDEGPDEGQPLEVDASTLYVSPVTDALPPILTTSVPPAAVCVLQPDLCPDRPEWLPEPLPWRDDIPTLIRGIQDQMRDLPVQPVPEGNAAVSFLGGTTRYQTAVRFDTPTVPEGEDVLRYELTLGQSQPSYHLNSPAFRRIILGAFETIGSSDPAAFAEGLAAALTEEDLLDFSTIMSVEACPLLEPFDPGGAPMASDAAELPQHEVDGDDEPAIDCTFGGNGVFDEDAGVWRIDLAFTAQAWADGEIDNHGVLLRPVGAPNLAFGDPDLSTNAQLLLDLTEVTAALETAEPFEPGDFDEFDEFDEPELGGEELGDEGFDAGDAGFDAGDDFDEVGTDLGDLGGDVGGGFDAPDLDDELAFDADAPDVADGMELGDTEEVALEAQAARPAGSEPLTPWWVWLLAPLLIGGAYLTGSAVLAPAPVIAGAGGGGALSRMLEKHAASSSAPTPR